MESRLEYDLQDVNRNIIALPEHEVKRNNKILGEVVRDQLLKKMQQKSALFEYLFRNIFYAGSFFCGLKVGHPDEYDLVFLLKLPECLNPIINVCTVPGFVNIQLEGMQHWQKGSKNYPSLSSPAGGKIIQCDKRLKGYPSISNDVMKNIIQSTAVPSRKPNPNHQKTRCRSQKMHNLWKNVRFNTALDTVLTRKDRFILCEFVNLLDDNYYLDTGKVSAWMEKIIQTSFDSFTNNGKYSFIKTSEGTFHATLTKSGPAFTLKLRRWSKYEHIIIDIDLVPGFVFPSENWPSKPFIPNPVPEKKEFFIVPKKPKKPDKKGKFSKCWRPSFQEQESVLINDMQNFKPCIKLLKRIRDVGNHKTIASYHLKTIFLWELEENETLWSEPLANVFLRMLRKCQRYFKQGVILNYWNPTENLIKGENRATLNNIANNFKKIVNSIELHPDNVFKYVD